MFSFYFRPWVGIQLLYRNMGWKSVFLSVKVATTALEKSEAITMADSLCVSFPLPNLLVEVG